MIGTERYMAPEQLADGTITPAADVYACGVVADEVLPQSRPPELREIVERCLREDPADRFTDARSLGEALATVDGDGEAGAVRRDPLAGSAHPAAYRDRARDEKLARSGRDRPATPFHRGPDRGDRGGARDHRRRRPPRRRLGRIGLAQQGREQPAASGARPPPFPPRATRPSRRGNSPTSSAPSRAELGRRLRDRSRRRRGRPRRGRRCRRRGGWRGRRGRRGRRVNGGL